MQLAPKVQSHRPWLALSSFAILSLVAPVICWGGEIRPAIPATPAASPTNPGSYAFQIGAFECIVVYDTANDYDPSSLFVNANATELAPAVAAFTDAAGKIHTPYAGLVVRTADHTVLIDTGAGSLLAPKPSHFLANLAAAGVDRQTIDTVLLTHGHLDHIGGTLLENGEPAFPKARYVMFRAEWDFWAQDNPDLSSLSLKPATKNYFIEVAHRQLLPLRDRIQLIAADSEIQPGIFALLAPGHTPGHMVVKIDSQGQKLLYISDLVLSPVGLEHSNWHSQYELDVARSQKTRVEMSALATNEKALVYAMHFPWPGLGHVVADRNNWQWHPVEANR